jgi:hypothetical protein|nr:MAG TPA: hypothetical protein [Bacteriophage sp.]
MTLIELYTVLQNDLLDVFIEYVNANKKALN